MRGMVSRFSMPIAELNLRAWQWLIQLILDPKVRPAISDFVDEVLKKSLSQKWPWLAVATLLNESIKFSKKKSNIDHTVKV